MCLLGIHLHPSSLLSPLSANLHAHYSSRSAKFVVSPFFCICWFPMWDTLFLLVHLQTSSLKFNNQLNSHLSRIKPSYNNAPPFTPGLQHPLSFSLLTVHTYCSPIMRERVKALPVYLTSLCVNVSRSLLPITRYGSQ